MNFLKLAILVFALGILQSGRSQDADYDLEKIETKTGQIYREVLILNSDEYGLTFRHRDGIAKERFTSLPTNLRMLYEVADEGDADVDAADSAKQSETEPVSADTSYPPLQVTVRTRVTFPLPHPALQLGGGFSSPDASHWPSWWPRYQPVHHLTNPYLRELAVRDFLYSSGLLPTPCGIRTYRLPGRPLGLLY
jgi:hypothetical protein